MKRASLATLLLLLVGLGLVWGLGRETIPVNPLVVPMGETVTALLPDAEGNPVAWKLSKREIAREELPDEVLPPPAPRETPPGAHTDSARAFNAQALEAWKHGDILEARDLFEAAIAADPEDAVPRSDYGRLLLLMTDYKEALPHLERAAELEPDSPRVGVDLLSFYERNVLLERALYARERAEKLADGRALVRDETGLWRLEGGRIYP